MAEEKSAPGAVKNLREILLQELQSSTALIPLCTSAAKHLSDSTHSDTVCVCRISPENFRAVF